MNSNLYIVFALGRSGHHAIINWLCKQSAPSLHFNNSRRWFIKQSEPLGERSTAYYKDRTEKGWKRYDYNYGQFNSIVLNFEEVKAETIGRAMLKKLPFKMGKVKHLVVVRDPYNLAASRLSFGEKHPQAKRFHEVTKKVGELWVQHLSKSDDPNFTIINYNKWFSDKAYRSGIAEKLGIKFTDAGINDVYLHQKSSFDDTSYDGQAQAMDVLNRYKKYVGLPEYHSIITPEMAVLSKVFFGVCPNA